MKKSILLLSFSLICSLGQAQKEHRELDNFEVNLRISNDKIVLLNKKGSAWKKLTFSKTKLPQAIDEYGMTELVNGKNKRRKSEIELADYTFTIHEKDGEIILEGIEGTAWINLTYTCNKKSCGININELGMNY